MKMFLWDKQFSEENSDLSVWFENTSTLFQRTRESVTIAMVPLSRIFTPQVAFRLGRSAGEKLEKKNTDREIAPFKAKAAKQAKSFNAINAARDTEGKRAADREKIRAHRDAGGNMQIKSLQKIRGLHGKGKGYLIGRRKEIKLF